MVAATAQDIAEGAVVTAAGVAAGDPSEAAGAVRISLGSCWVTAEIFSADFGEVARWWQQQHRTLRRGQW